MAFAGKSMDFFIERTYVSGKEMYCMKDIVIIEDDKTLSEGIASALRDEKLHIQQLFSLSEAEKEDIGQKDLLILDINLPDGSGLDYLKNIRQDSQVPVILLTANDMETDIVMGLESGADDYITKPFSLAVLRARVHTQLRKRQKAGKEVYRIDAFSFDFDKMEFYKEGRAVELSKTEQKLLKMLIANKGQTLAKDVLVDRIWTDGADYVDENALSVAIKRLRGKLEDDPSKPNYIKNIYGIGYTWAVKQNGNN